MITKDDIVEGSLFKHLNGETSHILHVDDKITEKRYYNSGNPMLTQVWDIELLVDFLNNTKCKKEETITEYDIIEGALFEHQKGITLEITYKSIYKTIEKRYNENGKTISVDTWGDDTKSLIDYLNTEGYKRIK